MSKKDRAGGLLLILGLALAAMGQFYFTYRREFVWDGALFWAAGIVLLTLLHLRARRFERGATVGGQSSALRWLRSLGEHPIRMLMAMGGLGFSVVAGWLAYQRSPSAGFADLLFLWVVGVASFLLACSPSLSAWPALWPRLQNGVKRWLSDNRLELVGLVALMALAVAVRAYDLEHIPANLGGDEGTQGAEALRLTDAPLGNPFSTGWYSVPTMTFLVYGASMRVLGATVGGLRTLSAVIGSATVLTTFLLARELWGRRVAWLSATLLACSHYHIHFSRLGSNQIADGLFVTVGLWLLIRALVTKQPIAFAAAGAVAGLGWYGYFGARLVGFVMAGYLGLQAVSRHRFLARHGRLLAIMLAAAVVVLAPLLVHYAAHPADVSSRLNQVSIFASGWLVRERELTGRSTVSLLLQQLWRSISAFNYTLDPTFWYRSTIPLLDAVSGVLFVFGLVWCMAHWRWPSSGLLLIWFCSALFAGWVMTENPPSSQRMVIVSPALAVLVGLGLDWLLKGIQRLVRGRAEVRLGLISAVMIAIASLNLGYYFLVYTPTRVYGNPTAEMTTVLARWLHEQGDDKVVYLHGPPFVYWDFGTLRFMAREVAGTDVPPPGEGDAPRPDLSRGARFVFHPGRVDELEEGRMRYPGGVEELVRSQDGALLYAVYEVSD